MEHNIENYEFMYNRGNDLPSVDVVYRNIEALKNQIISTDDAMTEFLNSQAKCDELQLENEDYKKEIINYKEELAKGKGADKASNLQGKNSELNEEVRKKKNQIEGLNREINTLKKTNKELKDNHAKELEERNRIINELKESLEKSKKKRKAIETKDAAILFKPEVSHKSVVAQSSALISLANAQVQTMPLEEQAKTSAKSKSEKPEVKKKTTESSTQTLELQDAPKQEITMTQEPLQREPVKRRNESQNEINSIAFESVQVCNKLEAKILRLKEKLLKKDGMIAELRASLRDLQLKNQDFRLSLKMVNESSSSLDSDPQASFNVLQRQIRDVVPLLRKRKSEKPPEIEEKQFLSEFPIEKKAKKDEGINSRKSDKVMSLQKATNSGKKCDSEKLFTSDEDEEDIPVDKTSKKQILVEEKIKMKEDKKNDRLTSDSTKVINETTKSQTEPNQIFKTEQILENVLQKDEALKPKAETHSLSSSTVAPVESNDDKKSKRIQEIARIKDPLDLLEALIDVVVNELSLKDDVEFSQIGSILGDLTRKLSVAQFSEILINKLSNSIVEISILRIHSQIECLIGKFLDKYGTSQVKEFFIALADVISSYLFLPIILESAIDPEQARPIDNFTKDHLFQFINSFNISLKISQEQDTKHLHVLQDIANPFSVYGLQSLLFLICQLIWTKYEVHARQNKFLAWTLINHFNLNYGPPNPIKERSILNLLYIYCATTPHSALSTSKCFNLPLASRRFISDVEKSQKKVPFQKIDELLTYKRNPIETIDNSLSLFVLKMEILAFCSKIVDVNQPENFLRVQYIVSHVLKSSEIRDDPMNKWLFNFITNQSKNDNVHEINPWRATPYFLATSLRSDKLLEEALDELNLVLDWKIYKLDSPKCIDFTKRTIGTVRLEIKEFLNAYSLLASFLSDHRLVAYFIRKKLMGYILNEKYRNSFQSMFTFTLMGVLLTNKVFEHRENFEIEMVLSEISYSILEHLKSPNCNDWEKVYGIKLIESFGRPFDYEMYLKDPGWYDLYPELNIYRRFAPPQ